MNTYTKLIEELKTVGAQNPNYQSNLWRELLTSLTKEALLFDWHTYKSGAPGSDLFRGQQTNWETSLGDYECNLAFAEVPPSREDPVKSLTSFSWILNVYRPGGNRIGLHLFYSVDQDRDSPESAWSDISAVETENLAPDLGHLLMALVFWIRTKMG